MTTQEFIFDWPLYTSVKISETSILNDLCECIRVDGYNPFRDIDTTYYLKRPIDSSYLVGTGDNIRFLRFECQRYGDYLDLLVHFNDEVDRIEKVGQYPSVASIHISQVKQYRKVLGESYILDFTKAMITFNPSTGEDIEPENLNEENKITYDACVGAIALLKEQEPRVMAPTEAYTADFVYVEFDGLCRE